MWGGRIEPNEIYEVAALLVEHVRFAGADALFDFFDVEVELAELEFFGEGLELVGLLFGGGGFGVFFVGHGIGS